MRLADSLHTLDSDCWLVGRDFNDHLKASEKIGENSFHPTRSSFLGGLH